MPEVAKSSRHSKITGDFAEHLVLYWLSKHGIECARVDHVGMDLIARRGGEVHPMGISVKSRSRSPGTEGTYLGIKNDHFDKLETACAAFGCDPYFAIVIDEIDRIDAYLIALEDLLTIHPKRNSISAWKMSAKWREVYAQDPRIVRFSLSTETGKWW